jgi:predicted nucleotidyltransferase
MSSLTISEISPELLKKYRPFRSVCNQQPASVAEEAKAAAIEIAHELKVRFCASRVMLFGSLARDDFHKWSDIDLAVWGVACSDYYRAVAFASGFSGVFKVDLVDARDCSDSFLQHILSEGVDL